MKITIVEMPTREALKNHFIATLRTHLEAVGGTDLLLLPELPASMPFWHLPNFDRSAWQQALADHEKLVRETLPALPAGAILSTRPIEEDVRRLNMAFLWTHTGGTHDLRAKYYLPEEEGGWERTWFAHGGRPNTIYSHEGVRLAPIVCSEIMAGQGEIRQLGREGVQLILNPRATEDAERWATALKMAAIASGAFVASSNWQSADDDYGFGGRAFLIGPDGDVIAQTSRVEPIITNEIDVRAADAAKSSYPRNVLP